MPSMIVWLLLLAVCVGFGYAVGGVVLMRVNIVIGLVAIALNFARVKVNMTVGHEHPLWSCGVEALFVIVFFYDVILIVLWIIH